MPIRTVVRAVTVATVLALAAPPGARAQVYNFGTMNGTGNLGTSEVFSLLGFGSLSVTASSGWVLWARSGGTGETGLGLCALGDVTHHNHSADTCDSDAEIGNDAGYITVNLSGLLPGIGPIGFELSSVQSGDDFRYKFGQTCAFTGAGSGTGSGSAPNDGNPTTDGAQSGGGNSKPYVWEALGLSTSCLEFDPVGSTQHSESHHHDVETTTYNNGDYLLMDLVVDPPDGGAASVDTVTPEPATMSLMATGLIGMAGAAIRRRRKS